MKTKSGLLKKIFLTVVGLYLLQLVWWFIPDRATYEGRYNELQGFGEEYHWGVFVDYIVFFAEEDDLTNRGGMTHDSVYREFYGGKKLIRDVVRVDGCPEFEAIPGMVYFPLNGKVYQCPGCSAKEDITKTRAYRAVRDLLPVSASGEPSVSSCLTGEDFKLFCADGFSILLTAEDGANLKDIDYRRAKEKQGGGLVRIEGFPKFTAYPGMVYLPINRKIYYCPGRMSTKPRFGMDMNAPTGVIKFNKKVENDGC